MAMSGECDATITRQKWRVALVSQIYKYEVLHFLKKIFAGKKTKMNSLKSKAKDTKQRNAVYLICSQNIDPLSLLPIK